MSRPRTSRVRRAVQDALGITAIRERMDHLEARILESAEETWERSRSRWRSATPDPDLTWHTELSGRDFVERAAAHGVFGPEARILEIGPGYGRLLGEALAQGRPFARYVGLDLSANNVEHLRGRFPQANVSFEQGDAETASLGEAFTAMVSSLTLKHLFPTFERALANVGRHMEPGGVLCFDLREGDQRYFEQDGVTYIRCYTPAEVEQILGGLSMRVIAFEQVEHAPGRPRLLVLARTAGSGEPPPEANRT